MSPIANMCVCAPQPSIQPLNLVYWDPDHPINDSKGKNNLRIYCISFSPLLFAFLLISGLTTQNFICFLAQYFLPSKNCVVLRFFSRSILSLCSILFWFCGELWLYPEEVNKSFLTGTAFQLLLPFVTFIDTFLRMFNFYIISFIHQCHITFLSLLVNFYPFSIKICLTSFTLKLFLGRL